VKFGWLCNGLALGRGRRGGRGCGEALAEALDIRVKLIVVPPENVVFLLHMLLVGPEVLPADLAVVRGGYGHLYRVRPRGGWQALLGLEHLPQPLLKVNPVSLQFALLCFLCEMRVTVSVRRRKEGVEWDRSGLKLGAEDLGVGSWLNEWKFTRREGRSRRRWVGPCSRA
jgi:hypothetical protein